MNNENKVHIHKAARPSPRLPLLWAPNLKGGHEGLFPKTIRKPSEASVPSVMKHVTTGHRELFIRAT